MKQLIPVISLFLALAVWVPSAHSSERVTATVDTLNQGAENLQVGITTGTVVEVLNVLASTTTAGTSGGTVTNKRYRYVKIDNLDSTFNLFCSNRSGVEISGGNVGDKIEPSKWKLWILKPGQPWYCICDQTTTAGCSALITAGR